MSQKNQLVESELSKIIAKHMRQVDQGENVDQKKLLADHPHLKADLEEYLADVALIEQLAGPTASDQLGLDQFEERRDAASQSGNIESVVSCKSEKKNSQNKTLQGQFGRYKIEKILGEGAMGSVYLAHDSELHRKVALKVPKIDDSDSEEELLERFYREAGQQPHCGIVESVRCTMWAAMKASATSQWLLLRDCRYPVTLPMAKFNRCETSPWLFAK